MIRKPTMPPENPQPPENFEKIAVLENAIEAQLIDSILTDQKIVHRIRSHHDTAYDGLFQAQKGWGDIEAPVFYRRQILAILTQIRNQAKETTD